MGCGTMPYRSYFSGKCSKYVGCDMQSDDEEIVICDGEELPFKDDSFDLVVSFQVLEHVRKPWKVVDECYRVTKKGGYALATVPFMFPNHSSPSDYYRYSCEGIKSLFESAGFEVVEIMGQCSSLEALFLTGNWYVNQVRGKLHQSILTRPFGGVKICL